MFLLNERLRQKYQTLNWPLKQPQLSSRYRGRPTLSLTDCGSCNACIESCPTLALRRNPENIDKTPDLDMGRCIFCGACASACSQSAISFDNDYHVAAASRDALVIRATETGVRNVEKSGEINHSKRSGIFSRSFKLRQVSAGGCNACEADCNVLGTLVYDLGRFGVEFTASPRHADAIALTGPISLNMRAALLDAWESVPEPRLLIAIGTCAISGGLFAQGGECVGGLDGFRTCAEQEKRVPHPEFRADIYIPGCPPNPWSILAGILLARDLA